MPKKTYRVQTTGLSKTKLTKQSGGARTQWRRQDGPEGPPLPQSSRQNISIRLNRTKFANLASLFLSSENN